MKRLIFISLLIIPVLVGCEKVEVPDGTPYCIKRKIRKMKKERVTNPPSSIWQYEYNGETVYYNPPICCDVPSGLVNKHCKSICSPDGGIWGNGNGKCPDFFSERTNEKLIWQDDRE